MTSRTSLIDTIALAHREHTVLTVAMPLAAIAFASCCLVDATVVSSAIAARLGIASVPAS